MVSTQISYLARSDLYKTEKPFILTFEPPRGRGEKTNHRYIPHNVDITDVRGRENGFSLDTQGFQFKCWDTSLTPTDFDDDETVKARYYPEVRRQVLEMFPETIDVIVFSHLRRKRSDEFQRVASKEPEFQNPMIQAHGDLSPDDGRAVVEKLLRNEDREQLRGLSFEILNVWRVTEGPNRDWPLGFCDFSTIDEDDIDFTDVIHRDRVGESIRLYPNSQHRWYFLDHQNVNEVAIFRTAHEQGFNIPIGMHAAFEHPESSPHQRRESMEARLVRFFKSGTTRGNALA